jgi:hypothetical protein
MRQRGRERACNTHAHTRHATPVCPRIAVHAAATYAYVPLVTWFGGVFGLSILDDSVLAAAA